MARQNVRPCQNCHGRGTVTVWNSKKKTYEDRTCSACGGTGKVIISNI